MIISNNKIIAIWCKKNSIERISWDMKYTKKISRRIKKKEKNEKKNEIQLSHKSKKN